MEASLYATAFFRTVGKRTCSHYTILNYNATNRERLFSFPPRNDLTFTASLW